jgi:anti-sigma factor RsiW
MSNHLSEDQFVKCIAGRPGSVERQHIAECPECSADLERFGDALSTFRSAIHDRVDDRMALRGSGVPPFPIRPVESGLPIWRWAVAAMAIVVFVMLPFLISKPVAQEKSEQLSVEVDADALMNAVNLRLSRTLPAPMEPMMALLPSNESLTPSGGVQ